MKKLAVLWLSLLSLAMSPRSGYFNVLDYGARPDGRTLCTKAIQKAIDACAAAGGGKVIIPAGRYLSRPLFLKNHVHVEVLAGATLLADTTISAYPSCPGRWEGIERRVYASLFTGFHLKDVSITGRGTLDGQGKTWWRAFLATRLLRKKAGIRKREAANPPGSPLKWPRPRVINLYSCQNVLIRDLTIVNSPSWTIHPVYCEDVTVENVRIRNPYDSPNTDGIDPESCRDVHIVNCFLDCGDDCIAIKSGYNEDGRRVNKPCENIVIANCTFRHGHSAVGIGSETSGGVWNVAVNNCVLKGTDRGLRVKTARGRGNVVKNIRASNLVMENVGTAISLNMFYGSRDETPHPVDETTPHARNIRISHITATDIQNAGEIKGLPEAPMSGVALEDMNVQAKTGMTIAFVRGVELRHVQVDVTEGPAFDVKKSTNLTFEGVTSTSPPAETPVIVFEDARNVLVRACRAYPGTDAFFLLKGKGNADFYLLNNLFGQAKRPYRFSQGASQTTIVEKK